MKRIVSFIYFLVASLMVLGQDMSFGKITITPYISPDSKLNAVTSKLLYDKLAQVATANGVSGGFEQRFIVTANANILNESETATIPQKTSIKVSFSFFVGDGLAGTLFNSCIMELTGVGDSRDEAMLSAIRKINTKDERLSHLLNEAKPRILDYYNNVAPGLIKDAEGFMAKYDYEQALSKLSLIPSSCAYYDKAHQLILKCGNGIIERNNNELLTRAKVAWGSNPNEIGAQEAGSYLAKVVVSSSRYKNEVESLSRQMSRQLIQTENRKIELEKIKILSSERLETERINASAKVASAFFGALPKLVYNIFGWF